MIPAVRQQALTVWLPLARGAGSRVERELSARRADLEGALATLPSLHFARLALVPDRDGFAAGLLLETTFDGELDAHRAGLARVFEPHAPLWAEAASGALGFDALVQRHALRAAAFYFAHRGLGVETIRAQRALDARAQAWLDVERLASSASPRDVAEQLKHALGEVTPAAALPGAHRLLLARVRERGFELGWAVLRAAWLELRDSVARRAAAGSLDPVESSSGEQSAFAHVVPLKAGRGRRELVELLTWLLDGWCADGPIVRSSEPYGVHSARWLLLPDDRLAFLAWHDGRSAVWLDRVVENSSRLVSLLWSQTQAFPRTRCLVLGGARRVARFKAWSRAHQLSSQIWYSAYPELSVTDIQRNRRLSELMAGSLDDGRARELCALL